MRVLSMVMGEGAIELPAYRNMDGTSLVVVQRGGAKVPLRITSFMSDGPVPIGVANGEPDVLGEVF